ncbi:MAG: hypothetical protein HQL24_10285 [Candidatus Omnitrophica bacterium]|nr:hypothetical protein [Candidatus Omnitrophota bacterium]
MKTFVRAIFLGCVIFFLLSLIAVSFYVYFFGKTQLEILLTNRLGRPVTIGMLFIDFPLGVKAFHAQIAGWVKAKEIQIQFSPETLSGRTVVISGIKINSPIFQFGKWPKDNPAAAGEAKNVDLSSEVKPLPHRAKEPSLKMNFTKQVLIREISVTHGRVAFQPDVFGRDLEVVLENLEAHSGEITLPLRSEQVMIDLKAALDAPQTPYDASVVIAKGWVDWPGRAMQAVSEIKSLNGDNKITAHLESVHNDLSVRGRIDASDMFTSFAGSKSKKNKTGAVLNALAGIGLNLGADFSFNTKMDAPKLTDVQFSGSMGVKE